MLKVNTAPLNGTLHNRWKWRQNCRCICCQCAVTPSRVDTHNQDVLHTASIHAKTSNSVTTRGTCWAGVNRRTQYHYRAAQGRADIDSCCSSGPGNHTANGCASIMHPLSCPQPRATGDNNNKPGRPYSTQLVKHCTSTQTQCFGRRATAATVLLGTAQLA